MRGHCQQRAAAELEDGTLHHSGELEGPEAAWERKIKEEAARRKRFDLKEERREIVIGTFLCAPASL